MDYSWLPLNFTALKSLLNSLLVTVLSYQPIKTDTNHSLLSILVSLCILHPSIHLPDAHPAQGHTSLHSAKVWKSINIFSNKFEHYKQGIVVNKSITSPLHSVSVCHHHSPIFQCLSDHSYQHQQLLYLILLFISEHINFIIPLLSFNCHLNL